MPGEARKRDVAGDGAGLSRKARERDGLARELSNESSSNERSSEFSEALSMRLEPATSSQEPDICERLPVAGLRLEPLASGTAKEKSGNSGRTRGGSADICKKHLINTYAEDKNEVML